MLARRTTLTHPLGDTIDMPRLVPSFSSKGFPFIKDKGDRILSEANEALELTAPTISDSILISAYDISHKYLKKPQRFYKNKGLVIIDSGGYELSPHFDSTEPKQGAHQPDDSYDLNDYKKVLSKLPSKYPIAITNFDHGTKGSTLDEQIIEAQKLFHTYPDFLYNFILKPTGKKIYLDIKDVVKHVDKMRKFHIIGVTEKELGGTLLERLTNIATIRLAMDRENMNAPIHVWGGLDPVITPLYFCAGAEIFDGVSWLRYGYHKDTAIARDSYTAIELAVHQQWRNAQAMRLGNNISYLETLTIRMQTFVDTGRNNFDIFETHADSIKKACQALCTKVPELKGGV